MENMKNSKHILSCIFMIISIGLFLSLSINDVEARESETTNKGTGPLYWITYEHQYVNDCPMPEDRWKANVDWIASDFRDYGYTMVCTDGWIEQSQKINENGYVISHNDSWQGDWTYWVEYCNNKGLDMGIYYNPLWVTQAAYNANCEIINTNGQYHIQDIVGSHVFDGGQNDEDGNPVFLYQVDTDKPGAEEFIKGYVEYFKNTGAKFLRVDFLGWYESGYTKIRNDEWESGYGSERYEKAIKWMNEACGDDMTLSLVMPNLYNKAQIELANGDMFRIDEDCFEGGWDHISHRRRGIWQNVWSQWANAFDGFTYWSEVTGRGQAIADGDFLRLNTFSTDEEKKSAVSLFTMAGSPICIADQYDTIGNNEHFYQNTEMILLNQMGLVGKPIDYDSERWAGQLPDGSWVVGLFNRNENEDIRIIDFHEDLGINGNADVRDLWLHEDLGSMTDYSANLDSHDCVILKIVPSGKKYEAEVASMIGAKKDNDHNNYSGYGFVDNMESVGSKIRFCINTDNAGTENLNIRYSNGWEDTRTVSLYVNGEDVTQLQLLALEDWDTWNNYEETITLDEGNNFIDIQYDSDDTGYVNIDYIELGTTGPDPLSTPEKYQGEEANLSGGASINDNHFFYSSTGFVDKIESVGSKVSFDVTVPEDGYYNVLLRYANGNSYDSSLSIYRNNTKIKQTVLPSLIGWDVWNNKTEVIYLDSGSNNITYKYDSGDGGRVNIDYISIEANDNTMPIELNNPGFETGNIDGWTEWHPSDQVAAYGVDQNDVHEGNYKLYFWSESAYKQSVHQIKTGLDNGTYTLKAWVKATAYDQQPSICRLEAVNYGGSDKFVNMTVDGIWRQYQCTVDITNGQIDMGFYCDSFGRTSMQIDKIELWKN
ncbi:hypothetical protein SH1V18_19290 [Vallitalea longa]|uniref:CBM6 domain-containing protein n=1 Tax=Vallitalea longa TaxID=2936439 RepID=A0A9W6DG74_9FIRM|nr:CBM35 domain-containing protein [Vallitalea longa]GKX29449.1 hypothetical protein SH1V18_19290 [Vallitalea longa]